MIIQEMIEINGKWFPHERDMTPEEEAEYCRSQAERAAEERQQPPTAEERLATLEAAMLEVILDG